MDWILWVGIALVCALAALMWMAGASERGLKRAAGAWQRIARRAATLEDVTWEVNGLTDRIQVCSPKGFDVIELQRDADALIRLLHLRILKICGFLAVVALVGVGLVAFALLPFGWKQTAAGATGVALVAVCAFVLLHMAATLIAQSINA